MAYVAWVGLLFIPLVFLLCAAWMFVRWQNEHDDENKLQLSKKRCKICLILAVLAAIVFLCLHLIFPLPKF